MPAWSLVGSFVAGGAIALAVVRQAPDRGAPREPPATAPITIREPPAPPSLPAATESPAPEAAPPVAPPARTAAPSPAARASAAIERSGGTLEAERALLDVARISLGRGDGAAALRAAEAHAQKFPRGVLAEEREAMIIQALRLLHRDDEASTQLDRFRARFPASLIRPALEAAADGGAP